MSRKANPSAANRPEPAAPRLREELQRLGLAPTEAHELAERLAGLARELPTREYRALLDGVVLGRDAGRSPAPKAPELQRILEDFASELQKLDEGLRLLTAFLARLRDHTSAASPDAKTLH